MSSDLMKAGAKVVDDGVPLLEFSRWWRETGLRVPLMALEMLAWDWCLECDGGVATCDRGEGDVKTADFGLLGSAVGLCVGEGGDGDAPLAKGLFRRKLMA